jgi:hypothetical protein
MHISGINSLFIEYENIVFKIVLTKSFAIEEKEILLEGQLSL